jgi:GxxExxY protein
MPVYHIHVSLGPGLLESVYEEEILYYELTSNGLNVERQKKLPVVCGRYKMQLQDFRQT